MKYQILALYNAMLVQYDFGLLLKEMDIVDDIIMDNLKDEESNAYQLGWYSFLCDLDDALAQPAGKGTKGKYN